MFKYLLRFGYGFIVLCLLFLGACAVALGLDAWGLVSFVLGPSWHGDYFGVAVALLGCIALIVSCTLLGDDLIGKSKKLLAPKPEG
jgi:hypothetical protein